jgi:hypothetical protein
VTRRLFYIALGATAGVLVVRRATAAARSFTPAGVQRHVSGTFGGLTEALRDFTAEMRLAMAEREDELRTTLGLDGSHDVVDAPGSTGGLADDVR